MNKKKREREKNDFFFRLLSKQTRSMSVKVIKWKDEINASHANIDYKKEKKKIVIVWQRGRHPWVESP